MKSKYLKNILFLFLLNVLCFSGTALAKLSEKQQMQLNQLNEISKPNIPTFGKIDHPLKGNISLYQLAPKEENILLQKPEDIVIMLSPGKTADEKLSELESKRTELQKTEEQGLNFIQPSLELSEEEQKSISEYFSRSEQEQLLGLWKATIERNKTIQFIVQKLSPANSTQESNSLLSKTIGAAIFLPFYALQAFSNNAGSYYGSQAGSRVLGSVVQGKMNKNQAQTQLSQTESIVLFMMIDEVAERLRKRYHSYKKLMIERSLATAELEETKKDTVEANDAMDSGANVIANIQRRAIEREIRRADAEMRYHRNALIELAGPSIVEELDQQLKLELSATQNTPLDFIGVQEN